MGTQGLGHRRSCQELRGAAASPRRLRPRPRQDLAPPSMITVLHRFLVWVVLLPVVVYRRVISPMTRMPTCRYLPTCSEYATEAVQTRGIFVGGALATWR